MGDFLLFGFLHYYPCGGGYDFVGRFDTMDAAQSEAKRRLRLSEVYLSRDDEATIMNLSTNEWWSILSNGDGGFKVEPIPAEEQGL